MRTRRRNRKAAPVAAPSHFVGGGCFFVGVLNLSGILTSCRWARLAAGGRVTWRRGRGGTVGEVGADRAAGRRLGGRVAVGGSGAAPFVWMGGGEVGNFRRGNKDCPFPRRLA